MPPRPSGYPQLWRPSRGRGSQPRPRPRSWRRCEAGVPRPFRRRHDAGTHPATPGRPPHHPSAQPSRPARNRHVPPSATRCSPVSSHSMIGAAGSECGRQTATTETGSVGVSASNRRLISSPRRVRATSRARRSWGFGSRATASFTSAPQHCFSSRASRGGRRPLGRAFRCSRRRRYRPTPRGAAQRLAPAPLSHFPLRG